jgi:hypothetical protein
MKTNKILSISIVLILLVAAAGLTYTGVIARPYSAATAPGLGQAGSYSVIGKAGVTDTGGSVLSGNVGADTSIDAGIVSAGQILAPDVNQAEADAAAAVGTLTGQTATSPILGALDGLTLVPGVYDIGAGSLGGGTLTLDGPGVFIFRATSSLTSAGSVSLINGATACNVFWYVPDEAIINGSHFVGTVIAGAGISFGDSVSLDGRAFSLTASVSLQNNSISGPSCASAAGPSLPDNPQPESGSTEAYVGTQTALTATAVAGRAGVPSTGGAPLNGDGTLWLILGFSALCVVILFYITRKIQRNNGPK